MGLLDTRKNGEGDFKGNDLVLCFKLNRSEHDNL